MLKDKTMTYISLFSSAGVGCYGFHMEGFECVATNELLPRRMDVQRVNKKCKLDSGYIPGDITQPTIKQKIYDEISKWEKLGNDGIDVIIATPPCQGISVINHKKNDQEINRNSLVVESVEIIDRIKPRFFIFENVMAFQKTLCITPDEQVMPIGEYIRSALGSEYIISGRILNFMNYGSNSSRTRTLMIGVSKKYRNNITPFDLYPCYRPEKTLREVIYDYPRLEWGEISQSDFYHAFRTYTPAMRPWIHDLKEGESAFDNVDPSKRPHRIIDGKRVENTRKNRDKYTRQPWDRFVQCVHTRNDQLAAQNTIHPEQDRVFSIRELMDMMTIPRSFRWVDYSLDELNAMNDAEKRSIYKAHEVNIRQCLGEAVPTEIMRQIAASIKVSMQPKRSDASEINRIIADHDLARRNNLIVFLRDNPLNLDIASLMRVTELCNAQREKNAAFYTNKFIVNEIMGRLPVFNKDEIRILEPSVGAGSFIPFLFKQYENVPHVILDVVDIDPASLEAFSLLLNRIGAPSNFTINQICHDFVTWQPECRYDLAVGNPPFSKLKKKSSVIAEALKANANQKTNNLAAIFLEKCIRCSDCVSLVLNKNILASEEYAQTRDYLRTVKIDSIIDFGRYGFTGVWITKEGKAVTLKPEEIDMLIEYIQEYYTPLNIGLTEFIEADKDAAKLFAKVRDLGISDDEIVSKLIESGILTQNLTVAITAAERNNAVQEFEQAIDVERTESFWQNWFSQNKWVLGSEYLNILPERDIDTNDIADYLMRSIDGFLDVVEIKRPDLQFWAGPDSHGNYYPTAQLTAAISQCLNYLYRIELQSNSVEFMERVDGTKTVKPQCMLVYGRSDDWGEDT